MVITRLRNSALIKTFASEHYEISGIQKVGLKNSPASLTELNSNPCFN